MLASALVFAGAFRAFSRGEAAGFGWLIGLEAGAYLSWVLGAGWARRRARLSPRQLRRSDRRWGSPCRPSSRRSSSPSSARGVGLRQARAALAVAGLAAVRWRNLGLTVLARVAACGLLSWLFPAR